MSIVNNIIFRSFPYIIRLRHYICVSSSPKTDVEDTLTHHKLLSTHAPTSTVIELEDLNRPADDESLHGSLSQRDRERVTAGGSEVMTNRIYQWMHGFRRR